MRKNKVIKSAEILKNDFISDKENQMLIDAYEIYCMDQNTKMKHAKEEGIAEGIAQTLKVLDMLKENVDISIIEKETGISKEKIIQLKKKI